MAALLNKGVEICYVAEDLAERGIARDELVAGANPIARDSLADLIGRYARVWYW